MFLNYLTTPIVVAALLSFLAGSFGYVITVLVIRPVLAYRRLRRRVRITMAGLIADPAAGKTSEFNALAIKLTEIYQKALPQWYQLSLANRGERPLEAAQHLTRLAKTRDQDQILKRAAAIQSALRLE
jgi:hypothetical protein